MKIIHLTPHGETLVDDQDFQELLAHSWRMGNNRAFRIEPGTRKQIYMHRQILGFPEGLDVDHIDGDPLNNQRSNLRVATRTQNQLNTHKRRNGKSGYKGVYWKKEKTRVAKGSWSANLSVGGKRYRQAGFSTPEEAARKYDEFALLHGGGFATLNFDAAMGAEGAKSE